jgi:hypothetical protein
VQLAEHRQRGEATRGGLVRGRQVVQMKQIGRPRAGAREQLDPGSDEPFVRGSIDSRKDTIGRTQPILEGGRKRNLRSKRLRTLERGRVVERVNIDPGEKLAAWVGSPAPPSEPAASVSRHPAAGRARASERVTCAEPPRGKKNSPDTTTPPAAAPPPRPGCCFHRESPAPRTTPFSPPGRGGVIRIRACVTPSRTGPVYRDGLDVSFEGFR